MPTIILELWRVTLSKLSFPEVSRLRLLQALELGFSTWGSPPLSQRSEKKQIFTSGQITVMK